jgi:ribosome-binding ATPase YchF (GTP1/OBG family)
MDTVDPVRDIEIINTELVLADLDSVEKRKVKGQKAAKSGDKKAVAELELLDKLEAHLNTGKTVVTLNLTPEEKATVKSFFLLTAKPTLFACNVAEEDLATADSNKFVQQVRAYVKEHHDTSAVVVSAEIESELVTLSEEETERILARARCHGYGSKQVDSGSLPSARSQNVPDDRRKGDPSLDNSCGRQSSTSGRGDPLRFREEPDLSGVRLVRRSGCCRLVCACA